MQFLRYVLAYIFVILFFNSSLYASKFSCYAPNNKADSIWHIQENDVQEVKLLNSHKIDSLALRNSDDLYIFDCNGGEKSCNL